MIDERGEVVVAVDMGEDLDAVYVTVGDGTAPADPTPSVNDGSTAASGLIDTGVSISTGREPIVKWVRYWGGNPVGDVKEDRLVRRLGTIHSNATDVSSSGSGTSALDSFEVPAGALGDSGGLRLKMLVNITGTNNTKSVPLVFGGSALVNIVFLAAFEGRASIDVLLVNTSTTTQRAQISVVQADGTNQLASATSSANTASAATMQINGFVANAGDTVTLESSSAELLPSA